MSTKPPRKRSRRKATLITCCGASNLGQVCNQAALELAEEGFCEVLCAAAIGARIRWAVERLRDAPLVVGINGCESRCARKILRDIGRPDAPCVTAADLEIEKSPGFFTHTHEVEKVKEAVRRAIVET